MINVNAWTSYSERIGDEYYFVTEDGNKNYRACIFTHLRQCIEKIQGCKQ